jgi:deoxyribonuclease-4
MLAVGPHLSISKGLCDALDVALSIGATTFQFFSRNPRGGASKPLDDTDLSNFIKRIKDIPFATPLCHAPYTLNPSSNKEETRDFARMVFKEDLAKLEVIPNICYNFHPGSHVGQGEEVGIQKTIEILNEVMTHDMKVTILLETMSGKGTEIGKTFEELKEIIDNVECPEHLGVCLDTCHVFCAGYDIKNDLDGVLDSFDKIIGLDKLKAIHMNDTFNDFATHKDHHQKLGEGFIGNETFVNIINNPRLKNIPIYLETPNEIDGYKKEIDFLKKNLK